MAVVFLAVAVVASVADERVGPFVREKAFRASEGGGGVPGVGGASDGGYVIAWQAGPGVVAQRYRRDGKLEGRRFAVSGAKSSGGYPDVAGLAHGNVAIAWHSDGDIYCSLYNRNNTVRRDKFRVNSDRKAMAHNLPAVSGLVDGGFVVAWNSIGQDTDGAGIYAARFDSYGREMTGEFRVNTEVRMNQFKPSVAGLSNGGFAITWQSRGQESPEADRGTLGVFAQCYAQDSAREGPEFQVNTETKAGQALPSIASIPDGGFVIVWQSALQDGDMGGIYAQIYQGPSKKIGGEFQVNTMAKADQGFPSVASLGTQYGGGFVVTWEGPAPGNTSGPVVTHGQAFSNGGDKIDGEFVVQGSQEGSKSYPQVAGLASGGFVVAWERGSRDGVFAQRYQFQAPIRPFSVGRGFNSTVLNSNQQSPAVSRLNSGAYVVAWQGTTESGDYAIFAQLYANTGKAASAPFRVSTHTRYFRGSPEAAALTTGGFVITWTGYQNELNGVFARLYNDEAVATTGVVHVDVDAGNRKKSARVATLGEGQFVVVWAAVAHDDSASQVKVRVMGQGGIAAGPVFNVSQGEYDMEPSVARVVGGFVVVWMNLEGDKNARVFGQLFTTSVSEVAAPFQVSGLDAGSDQAFPVVAGFRNGGFVVAWESAAGPWGEPDIYAQRYDANGAPTGLEVRVNTHTRAGQRHPAISTVSGDGYVVAWEGDTTNDIADIYWQTFDASGDAVGSEFQVTGRTGPSGNHRDPAVAGLMNGDFVVVWSSYADGAGYGIYGQLFGHLNNRTTSAPAPQPTSSVTTVPKPVPTPPAPTSMPEITDTRVPNDVAPESSPAGTTTSATTTPTQVDFPHFDHGYDTHEQDQGQDHTHDDINGYDNTHDNYDNHDQDQIHDYDNHGYDNYDTRDQDNTHDNYDSHDQDHTHDHGYDYPHDQDHGHIHDHDHDHFHDHGNYNTHDQDQGQDYTHDHDNTNGYDSTHDNYDNYDQDNTHDNYDNRDQDQDYTHDHNGNHGYDNYDNHDHDDNTHDNYDTYDQDHTYDHDGNYDTYDHDDNTHDNYDDHDQDYTHDHDGNHGYDNYDTRDNYDNHGYDNYDNYDTRNEDQDHIHDHTHDHDHHSHDNYDTHDQDQGNTHDDNDIRDQNHSQDHTHDHDHTHNNYDTHDHTHDHDQDHTHDHTHDHGQDTTRDHTHDHGQDHTHDNDDTRDQDQDQDQAHDHTHDHGQDTTHDHTHDHGQDQDQAHDHTHDHQDTTHDHTHDHGQDHTHDKDGPHDQGQDQDQVNDHTHDHGQDHTHDHTHDHGQDNTHDHTHEHGQDQDQAHDHTHDHDQDHTHDHTHDHGQDNTHDHTHDHGQDQDQAHDHTHDHTHDHGQDQDQAHDHTHDHDQDHTHDNDGPQGQDQDHTHDHTHDHGQDTHDHDYDHTPELDGTHDQDQDQTHDHTHDHDHAHDNYDTHDHTHDQGQDHTHDHGQDHTPENDTHDQDQDQTGDHTSDNDSTHDHTHDHDHGNYDTVDQDHGHDHDHTYDHHHDHVHDHTYNYDHVHDHAHETAPSATETGNELTATASASASAPPATYTASASNFDAARPAAAATATETAAAGSVKGHHLISDKASTIVTVVAILAASCVCFAVLGYYCRKDEPVAVTNSAFETSISKEGLTELLYMDGSSIGTSVAHDKSLLSDGPYVVLE